MQQPDGRGGFVVLPSTCCRCGPIRVVYIGLAPEPGHGSFISYQPAPQVPKLHLARGPLGTVN